MECNFDNDDITHIYCRHFSDLRQVICELNLKVRLCPIKNSCLCNFAPTVRAKLNNVVTANN